MEMSGQKIWIRQTGLDLSNRRICLASANLKTEWLIPEKSVTLVSAALLVAMWVYRPDPKKLDWLLWAMVLLQSLLFNPGHVVTNQVNLIVIRIVQVD